MLYFLKQSICSRKDYKMNILVLNGSPRPKGKTAEMCAVFREAAQAKGHHVTVIDVCRKNIKGCLACEYCHGKGEGVCIQKDDEAILAAGKDLIRIIKNDSVGIDTGIYLRTDSPYDLHRRLVDEGVIFVMDPKRTDLGLITSFKDDDGNIIYAIEVK